MKDDLMSYKDFISRLKLPDCNMSELLYDLYNYGINENEDQQDEIKEKGNNDERTA